MIDTIKNKAANFIVNQKLKERPAVNQSFKNLFRNAFTFLVVMPVNESDFNKCMDVLKYLDKNEKHITVFSFDFRRNLINHKYRPQIIEYGVIDVSKLNLPSKRLIELLSRKNFNAVIDLNRGENLFCSFVANLVNAPLRIGFKKKNSDKFYNVQIDDVADNPENSYKNFLNCLQMF